MRPIPSSMLLGRPMSADGTRVRCDALFEVKQEESPSLIQAAKAIAKAEHVLLVEEKDPNTKKAIPGAFLPKKVGGGKKKLGDILSDILPVIKDMSYEDYKAVYEQERPTKRARVQPTEEPEETPQLGRTMSVMPTDSRTGSVMA